MVSVLILTKNEEETIERCIESVSWSDDIVVFDSFSEDRTVELARRCGVRVEMRVFDNYANQRNAALALDYTNDWILMVDADECVSAELRDEILSTLANVPSSVDMFQMRRKDYFFGRWIKHASAYPTWFGRLVRKGAVRVEREVNEEYHANGDVVSLQGHLIHYPFSKGLAFWFDRHNRYSTMEALALVEEVGGKLSKADFVSRTATVRRRALKQLAYRLPGRPLVVFIYLYIFRFGWVDGFPGFRYSVMRSMYEYMIDLKVAEIRHEKRMLEGEIV
ncbi:glycosyltransferase family 2 protein [Pontiella sp.]|uniref:glycosyltransferase family 2 protein n=1 Tax=Pontiella sp. TaxID=2837462 RepID=UPI0035627EF6